MEFNSRTNEKGRLIEMINHAQNNNNMELEALIHSQGYLHKINYDDFLNCIRRIKNQKEFKMLRPSETLNIGFPHDTDFKTIRVSVLGSSGIKNYCSSNSLRDLGSNLQFVLKKPVYINGKYGKLDLEDYNIRINIKEEVDITFDETSNDKLKVEKLKQQWMEVPKNFRYKKTYSYLSSDNLFRCDFSIIKKSKVNEEMITLGEIKKRNLQEFIVKPKNFMGSLNDFWNMVKNDNYNRKIMVYGQPKYFQLLENSGTLEAEPEYEIEVEFIGQKSNNGIKFSDLEILNRFIETKGIILQALQRSFFLLGEKERIAVIKDYQKLTGVKGHNIFKGPLLLTLESYNLEQMTNRHYNNPYLDNIRKNYVVSEKADGDRNFLFIDSRGELYMINRTNLIRKIGMKIQELSNSIFDGEYITKDANGKNTNLIMLFDAYFMNGNPVWKSNFNVRYGVLSQAVSLFNSLDLKKFEYPLMINRKTFLQGDTIINTKELDISSNDTMIFEASGKILNKINVKYGGLLDIGHQFSYATDGLVFTPINLAVGQNFVGEKITDFSNAQFWKKNFKWKPPTHNSIDFSVSIYRQAGTNEMTEEYYNGIKYRQVHLKISYNPDFHNPYNSQRVINENLRFADGNNLTNFSTNYPFVGYIDSSNSLVEQLYIASFPLDNNGNMITSHGEIIMEGEVVECIYNLNEDEPRFRWKPYILRTGKKANGYHTAINILRSIYKPITIDMIITGNNLPENDIYYHSSGSVKTEYYSNEMKLFHNFVKTRLITHVSKEFNKPSLIDFGCGKLGDFHKWRRANIQTVIGLDVSHDNIDNPLDGAGKRVLDVLEKDPNAKKLVNNLLLIKADCSRNLSTGEAGLDELNQYYLKILYGLIDVVDYSKLGRMSGIGINKFNMVSSMFTIHYFFKNMETLNGFITNIYQNLKNNGIFFGCMIDGSSVYETLGKNDEIGEYQEEDKSRLIWRIRKNYDNKNGFPANESSVGKEIKVDFESITHTSVEYLVNFKYLVKLLDEYGITLVDSKMFHESPNSFLDEFYVDNPEAGKILRKKKDLLKYSLFHRWFIFRKTNFDNNDDFSELQQNESDVDLENNPKIDSMGRDEDDIVFDVKSIKIPNTVNEDESLEFPNTNIEK